MSFGLSAAPATFQGAMTATLQPVLRKSALVFFDDILVYSKTLADHVLHLTEVRQFFQKDNWEVKRSKCSFAQSSIAYLGHIISGAGVATDPDKIEEIAKWKVPENVKELRSFLGLGGYYWKFVRFFGVIARPLSQLLKKGVHFNLSQEANNAFLLLKRALMSAPVLAIPDFTKTFFIKTDASDTGIGAVLQQGDIPWLTLASLWAFAAVVCQHTRRIISQSFSQLNIGALLIYSMMNLSSRRINAVWYTWRNSV